jgi:putative membrane protein
MTMMYGWDGWGWGGWILMTQAMVVFWAAVIIAIVFGIRYLSSGSASRSQAIPGPARTAEDVLADRFARGEIDEDEYRRRVAALREHRAA